MAWQSSDRTAAFEQIMLRHERMVLRVALRMLGRLEDAQDLSRRFSCGSTNTSTRLTKRGA
ncbi:MAG: hypothetical protein QM757_17875 [Paludibaculum sp.]